MNDINRYRALSLIEVLIVIFIISVLIAILIPSMMYLRSRAKQASMITQMNKLTQAMDHYISEYNTNPAVYTHQELKDHRTDVTQTENVLFAMQGGLVYDNDGNPPDIATLATDVRSESGGNSYKIASFGLGSTFKDDSAAYSRQGAYYNASKNEIRQVTGTSGEDNFIPDIVDPVNGMPLLIYTTAPYPKDSSGYPRGKRDVIPVSWDDSRVSRADSGLGSGYGLVWRSLNDDFIAAESLSSGTETKDQLNNSLLSDQLIAGFKAEHDHTNSVGASSNLSWHIKDWSQINDNHYFRNMPNTASNYQEGGVKEQFSYGHGVTKGYWIISAGYDGVYFNKEGTEVSHDKKYYHNGTKYSSYEEERDRFESRYSKGLMFIARWYSDSSPLGKDNDKDIDKGNYGRRDLKLLTKHYDDLVRSGGQLDESVE